jgi:hypothetical protein
MSESAPAHAAAGRSERAGTGARAPTLVVLPDGDARVPATTELLGATASARLVASARRVGFDRVVFAPGTLAVDIAAPRDDGEGGREHGDGGVEGREAATGDRVDGPALVAYDTATIRAGLLELMVAHPLEDGERYTLYDGLGRPVATFFGHLEHVPAILPICEELPYPEGIGPADVARVVDREDLRGALNLVVDSEGVFPSTPSMWRRWIGIPTLRVMAAHRAPTAQLELLALVLVAATLPLSLVGAGAWCLLAAVCLLLGVHTSKLIKSVRVLRGHLGREVGDVAGERLARAARPLGHAAMSGGLTYGLLAADRADIAGLVLLAAGAGATVLALVQARYLLRGREAPVFALPDAHAVAARLGVRLPPLVEGAPLFELAIVFAAIPGHPVAPWAILLGGAAARLWRWYAGPLGAAGD